MKIETVIHYLTNSKNSTNLHKRNFITHLMLSKGYSINYYLTWSKFRQLYLHSITRLNKRKKIHRKKTYISLEEHYDYYLQLWKISNTDSTRITLKEERLYRIPNYFQSVYLVQ